MSLSQGLKTVYAARMPLGVCRSPGFYRRVNADQMTGTYGRRRRASPRPLPRPKRMTKTVTDRLNTYAPYMLSVLRIVTALLFIAHGTGKYFGFPAIGMPSPSPLSLIGVAGLIEIIGGLLLVVGLYARAAAFIMSGEMAIAYFLAHQPRDFFPILNQGESAVLFCFVFLYIVFAGPGAWSIDEARTSSRMAYRTA
jgi:putative oxidoreductase